MCCNYIQSGWILDCSTMMLTNSFLCSCFVYIDYSRRAKRLVFNLSHRFIFIRQIIREFWFNFGMPVDWISKQPCNNNPTVFRIVYKAKRIRILSRYLILWLYCVSSLHIIPYTVSNAPSEIFQIESWILVIHFKTYNRLVCRVTELLYHKIFTFTDFECFVFRIH